MAFLKASAVFEDHTQDNIKVIMRAETEFPDEWVRTFKRLVIPLTPKTSGGLRRSIITRKIPGGAEVTWRSRYAKAQDDGGHTVNKKIRGTNRRDGGYGIIMPGFYRYKQYTTPGTGPDFARKAARATHNEVPAMWRKLGLIK